ncbi:MAG TPA: UDP-glucose 4-epimerase GalE [Candidatus Nitrosocosmicus sp.]|nr:UDP-glucose 4-epimerase GalE [Candidatus Nitrosocosmicus sp.]
MSINKDSKIAITGGAGYIGSFTIQYLKDLGFTNLVILDNFSTGRKENCLVRNIEVDLMDKDKLNEVFLTEQFESVIHFASLIVVSHSMEDPYWYFKHNYNTSLNLLECMRLNGTKHIVFSSTCALYGEPENVPITEKEPIKAENVYAESKAMIETLIKWYQKIYGINFVLLRYFNACGAHIGALYGEKHIPETHLIPAAIHNIIQGKSIEIFGNDYDTKDGTAIRDYIHVDDLASAHHLALEHLYKGNKSDIFNLGTGNGQSVSDVVEALREVAKDKGYDACIEYKPRRAGDVPQLFADNSKAKEILGWNPTHLDIKEIVNEAFVWILEQEKRHLL